MIKIVDFMSKGKAGIYRMPLSTQPDLVMDSMSSAGKLRAIIAPSISANFNTAMHSHHSISYYWYNGRLGGYKPNENKSSYTTNVQSLSVGRWNISMSPSNSICLQTTQSGGF